MKSNHFALIMAGGQGTRFWPWSTAKRPKQFLAVIGKQPLITQTYRRLRKFVPVQNIFVIADKKYLPAVNECLPGFPRRNFIAEPAPRNTAPALIQANIVLSRIDPRANLLVVPADHCIRDEKTFAGQLRTALEYAENHCIITAGIRPSEPHTGYGYIQFIEDNKKEPGAPVFFPIKQFREKPDQKTAMGYLKKGNFYWNSGMFIYKLAFFREFIKKYAKYYDSQYEKLEKSYGNTRKFAEIYKAVRPESIDYALMEKMREAVMFKAAFSWNDVGSWSSVFEMNEKDPQNNMCRGRIVTVDTRDSLLFSSEKKPLAVIGLEGIAVIDTADGILVAPIGGLQQVKRIYDMLKKGKR